MRWLLLLVFGGLGALLLVLGTSSLLERVRAYRAGVETTGVVIDNVEHSANRSFVFRPRIRFTTPDGLRHTFTSSDGTGPEPEYLRGTEVPVRYLPRVPEQAELSTFSGLWGGPLLCLLLGLFFLAPAVVLFRLGGAPTPPGPIPSASEEPRPVPLRFLLLFSGAFASVGAPVLAGGLVWTFHAVQRFHAGVTVTGTVVAAPPLHPRVRFSAPGGVTQEVVLDFAGSQPSHEVDDTLTLLVPPDRPDQARLYSAGTFWLAPLAITLLGGAFTAVGVGVFVVGRRGR